MNREALIAQEVEVLNEMILDLKKEFFPSNTDADVIREAVRRKREPFIWADTVGGRCRGCKTSFKDCSLGLRKGDACCNVCAYTDTHAVIGVNALLKNRPADPDAVLVQKAVRALDVAKDLLQSIKFPTPEDRMAQALKKYREVEDKDQLAAEATSDFVDAVEAFLKSREAE